MSTIRLSIAEQFSRTPGSRYEKEGDFSGEAFRRDLLAPMVQKAISTGSKLLVDLDGTAGFGTSFLEEAFGGLIRRNGINADHLRAVLLFKSEEEDYLIEDVNAYINDAESNQ